MSNSNSSARNMSLETKEFQKEMVPKGHCLSEAAPERQAILDRQEHVLLLQTNYNRVEKAVRDIVNGTKSASAKAGRSRRLDCDDVLHHLDITFQEYMEVFDPEDILLNRMVVFAKSRIERENMLTNTCDYVMKSGKNKGKPCGKSNCKKHNVKEEDEEEE